jgi:CTP synthase
MSSLGKGVSSASLGAILQARGFSVCVRKLELYFNFDSGTLSPYQHGEVFVTNDGTESDLDLGHYERYTGMNACSTDYTTTGRIYSNIIAKERRGDYLGETIQVIPHVTDEIQAFITHKGESYDFIIIEIGGTVGDIEGAAAMEAVRQLRNDLGVNRTMFVHLTYLPYMKTTGEQKTKPTQHSVKNLLHAGIQPDVLLCRCEHPITESVKKKIALFCNVQQENVIAALDVSNMYKLPLNYIAEKFDERVCVHFGLDPYKHVISEEWSSQWLSLNKALDCPKDEVTIAIVGKYTELEDAYKSIKEAITHAAAKNEARVNIKWCNSEKTDDIIADIRGVDGVLVPGGFGVRGIENKIMAIKYARENNIPFFGICLGMQLAVIEILRNVGGIRNANSTEIDSNCAPVIGLMSEWQSVTGGKETRTDTDQKGGTMRLGSYPCQLLEHSLVGSIYGTDLIQERHRHRYEFNLQNYGEALERAGVCISGKSPDGTLAEVIEHINHPWFVAVQFHPEFKSRPLLPHPLFDSFIAAACAKSNRQ